MHGKHPVDFYRYEVKKFVCHFIFCYTPPFSLFRTQHTPRKLTCPPTRTIFLKRTPDRLKKPLRISGWEIRSEFHGKKHEAPTVNLPGVSTDHSTSHLSHRKKKKRGPLLSIESWLVSMTESLFHGWNEIIDI